jgi:sterol desaturase/sphingolipid hydroxylase (fatty acid hydroxylase superfamily)
VILQFILFAVGYFLAAIAYYANHRWIFHGRPRGPQWLKALWKRYSKYHSMHHAKWKLHDPETKKWMTVPTLAKQVSLLMLVILGIAIGPGAPIGIGLFFIVYGIRHGSIHGCAPWPFQSQFPIELKEWKKASSVWKHHMSHHLVDPNINHSGVHPFIDRMFGTYQNPDDILSQSKLVR